MTWRVRAENKYILQDAMDADRPQRFRLVVEPAAHQQCKVVYLRIVGIFLIRTSAVGAFDIGQVIPHFSLEQVKKKFQGGKLTYEFVDCVWF